MARCDQYITLIAYGKCEKYSFGRRKQMEIAISKQKTFKASIVALQICPYVLETSQHTLTLMQIFCKKLQTGTLRLQNAQFYRMLSEVKYVIILEKACFMTCWSRSTTVGTRQRNFIRRLDELNPCKKLSFLCSPLVLFLSINKLSKKHFLKRGFIHGTVLMAVNKQ